MPTEQLIPLIVIAIMLPLIVLRNRRPRTLRLQWMWVTPALIVPLIGFGLWGMSMQDPAHAAFDLAAWAILAVGLLLGAAFGWWRGKMVTIQKTPEGELKAQASPLGVLLIVGLIVGRSLLRPWIEANAVNWHINPVAVLDAFLLFAAGVVVMQRVEMWIRARRIQAGGTDAHVEASAA